MHWRSQMSSTAKSCAITRTQESKRRHKIACRVLAIAVLSLIGVLILDNEILLGIGLGLVVCALTIDKNIRRMF